MTMSPSITESQVFALLRAFIMDVIGGNVEVVQGLDNRVPAPKNPFICLSKVGKEGIEGSNYEYVDNFQAMFTASIAGTVMTVTAVASGTIAAGQSIAGTNIPSGVGIVSLGTGIGGVGTYNLNTPLTVASGTVQAAQTPQEQIVNQPIEMKIQVDCYGPSAGDWSSIITTIFESDICCDFFHAQLPGVDPLYAETSHQSPLINGEMQYEERWTSVLHLQYNPSYTLDRQFMGAVSVKTIEVDANYAP